MNDGQTDRQTDRQTYLSMLCKTRTYNALLCAHHIVVVVVVVVSRPALRRKGARNLAFDRSEPNIDPFSSSFSVTSTADELPK